MKLSKSVHFLLTTYIEDKVSGVYPIFEREGGRRLKKWIDEGVISSISIWQIDRSGRDLRDILNFIHYATERNIPIHFLSEGLKTIDDNGEETEDYVYKILRSFFDFPWWVWNDG